MKWRRSRATGEKRGDDTGKGGRICEKRGMEKVKKKEAMRGSDTRDSEGEEGWTGR